MKIILSRRGEGKTKACVEYLRQHPRALMITHSRQHVEYARREFTRNEYHVAERIQTWEWLLDEKHKMQRHRFDGIIIDDLDALLTHMLEMKIEAVAMTWPNAREKKRNPFPWVSINPNWP